MRRFQISVFSIERLCKCIAAVATGLAFSALPAYTQEMRDAQAQWRDAYIHLPAAKVYATAYDSAELWVIDLATGERLNRIPTGKGPADLAYDSSSDTLAVVNRLDSTVSLIDRSSERVISTLATGQGPADIVAIGAGNFVVAESFAGRVALITAAGQIRYPFDATPAVPAFLAVSSDLLVVGASGTPELNVYVTNPPALQKRITLPENPVYLASGPDGKVLV